MQNINITSMCPSQVHNLLLVTPLISFVKTLIIINLQQMLILGGAEQPEATSGLLE